MDEDRYIDREHAKHNAVTEAYQEGLNDGIEQCIDMLMELHERSEHAHNYYLYAASVLRGDSWM